MTLMYVIGGFLGGFIALREYFKQRSESGGVKAIPYFLLSLFLTLIAMCALCGFLSQLAASITAASQ